MTVLRTHYASPFRPCESAVSSEFNVVNYNAACGYQHQYSKKRMVNAAAADVGGIDYTTEKLSVPKDSCSRSLCLEKYDGSPYGAQDDGVCKQIANINETSLLAERNAASAHVMKLVVKISCEASERLATEVLIFLETNLSVCRLDRLFECSKKVVKTFPSRRTQKFDGS